MSTNRAATLHTTDTSDEIQMILDYVAFCKYPFLLIVKLYQIIFGLNILVFNYNPMIAF